MPATLANLSELLWSNTSTDALGQVIGRATAPVFLLSAVASFISVLIGRLGRIVDRIRSLNAIAETDAERAFLKQDLPRLKRRARLAHRAISLSLASGIATTMIVVFMFAGASVGIRHEWASALLFVITQVLFAASLVCFSAELRISLTDYDNYE